MNRCFGVPLAAALAWISLIPAAARTPAETAAPRAADARESRRIRLDGAPNFRDLGGYGTGDGKQVKWRLVYRSGALVALTAADYERLAPLNIATVCDFRSNEERTSAPTRWKGKAPSIISLPIFYSDSPIGPMLAGGGYPNDARDVFRDYYRRVPFDFAAQYRTVFDTLIEGGGPVLFHCSAGKDRTGMFAALLLSALGVPRKTVVEDFLLSNRFTGDETIVSTLHTAYVQALGPKVRKETVRMMTKVDRSYIEEMFKSIESRRGSVREYLRTDLGLTDEKIAALRQRLLTD